MRRRRSGQAAIEFALLYAAVILPLTFMIIFVSEMLWVWHSVVDFTRDGARYAATHCWMGDGSNVLDVHVHPRAAHDRYGPVPDRGRRRAGRVLFADPATGQLSPFTCASGADAAPTASRTR